MKTNNVTIIDYGVGNLLSVKRGIEYFGAEVVVSSNPDVILSSERVILPGVGAFSNGMKELEKTGLDTVVKKVAEKGIPLLGICLGMQMLFDESEEFGLTNGLGLIEGKIVKIPTTNKDGKLVKIPHIGWNSLDRSESISWEDTILKNNNKGDEMYFVHSFMAIPKNKDNLISFSTYQDIQISSVVQCKNIMGCQFHPEKSGDFGLKVLQRFLDL
ncbi:imidazole glycerol phosphate synthase subunit HisH [Halobacteriovorax marinus]|uniref:Imidazole glycerol phosphate synthase subunit HisH n=1 Tax=Halobacteriovorax marinus TaxID=97084 RepID=A0A1Y5FBE5_9BACT|nr:imidazole glycerol phosphate synthase subunit HisH [Halobacteriovorax marinus]